MRTNSRTLTLHTGISFLIAALVLMLGVASVEAGTPVERSGKASAKGFVIIENIAGSIKVEGWSKEEIQVTGTLGEEVEELEFKTGSKKSVINVVYPRKIKTIDEGADLVIMVPKGSSVEVECISASIDVKNVAGAVEVASISGAIEIVGNCTSVEAEAISGVVIIEGATPEVSVENISGRVRLTGETADVEVETVSGDIDLNFDKLLDLSVESVTGSADVRADLDRKGDFSFDLHSGSLILTVPADLSAEFEISTFNGDIDSGFGHKAKRTSKYAPGQELEFTTGGGDARIRINTFSGDVTIKKQ